MGDNSFEIENEREEIDEIEFKIHGLQNLRNAGEPKPVFLSFGIGCNWFQTDFVQSSSPTWQECKKIKVRSSLVPLRVSLCESLPDGKHQVLGRLKIEVAGCHPSPVTELQNDMHTVPFLNRGGIAATIPGYLIYECYVSRYRSHSRLPAVDWLEQQLPRLPDLIQHSWWPNRHKLLHRCSCASSEDSPPDSAATSSNPNRLTALPRMMEALDLSSNIANSMVGRSRSFSRLGDIDENKEYDPREQVRNLRRMSRTPGIFPHVKDVNPKEGSVLGGTRLNITGENLGLDAQDITGIYICGSNCLASLEYESDTTIYCTTKAWRGIVGNVTVITASGGRSQGGVKFKFVGGARGSVLSVMHKLSGNSLKDSGIGLGPMTPVFDQSYDRGYFRLLKTVDESTQTEDFELEPCSSREKLSRRNSLPSPRNEKISISITVLENEIIKLKMRNAQLQTFIDDLISRALEEMPDGRFLEGLEEPPNGTL